MSLLIIFQADQDVAIDGAVFRIRPPLNSAPATLESGDQVVVLRPHEPVALLPGVTVTFFEKVGSDGTMLAFDAPRGCLIRRIRRQTAAEGGG